MSRPITRFAARQDELLASIDTGSKDAAEDRAIGWLLLFITVLMVAGAGIEYLGDGSLGAFWTRVLIGAPFMGAAGGFFLASARRTRRQVAEVEEALERLEMQGSTAAEHAR